MKDLGFLSIKEAQEGMKRKDFSKEDLFSDCLENIKKTKDYNIYTEFASEFKSSKSNGALADIPGAIKDVFSTKDFYTTACSEILKGYKSPFNAVCIERLLNEGSYFTGKVNTDEFTCGASTESSCYGPTKNPYDKSRVSGGSSGGSAVAVAMGTSLYSMGTDTGGSIRQPASFCNIVGLKVSYGRVPRSGVLSMASSFDTIGPMARTVEDVARVLNVIAGHSEKDSTTPKIAVPNYLDGINDSIRGKVIGIPQEYFGDGVDEDTAKLVMDGVKTIEKCGAKIKQISLPHTKYGVTIYYILSPAEVSANMARYDGIRFGANSKDYDSVVDSYYKIRGIGFGKEIKRRILMGTYVLSSGYYEAYYSKAQKVRTLVRKDFDDVFKEVDYIIGPVSPFSAFKIGEITDDPLANYKADMLTIPASAAGLPAISVPCGFDEKEMPVGLQIIGQQFNEQGVLNIANIYERETKYFEKRPTLET